MQRIIFIIPYFGKWPIWMELYLDSLRRNPTIDFLFITDCDTTVLDGIPNVRYKRSSFERYIDKYRELLGKEINIPNPYKICDLRPFYALVHAEDIKTYDFFGWTDLDLVLGNLRQFYTEQILKNHDVLSTHESRLSGHCALLRNTPKHKLIGYKIYRWKESLKNPQFVGIDEHGITNALQMTLLDKVAEKMKFSKNNALCNFIRRFKIRKHYFVEQYTTPFTPIPWIDGSLNEDQPNEWRYFQGVITNTRDIGRNFMYLHFMNFKSSQWRINKSEAPWEKNLNFNVVNYEDIVEIDDAGIKNQIYA